MVAGDGRADSSPRPEDHDGINTRIVGEIANAALQEGAMALLWTGDLSYLAQDDPSVFEAQLTAWRTMMEPLYDHNVIVLPVRGNHEVAWYTSTRSGFSKADITNAKAVWDNVFSGRYALPPNGPEGEENLSFYYEIGNVLIVGLDNYENGEHTVNQEWLNTVLAEDAKPFVFVFGHEPLFMAGNHGSGETLAAHLNERDIFLKSLMSAGVRAYLCGHDHLYDHMRIRSSENDAATDLHQFVAGTAGAPFYHGSRYKGRHKGWTLTQISHTEDTYGYILITITDGHATITFKERRAANEYEPESVPAFHYDAAVQQGMAHK